MKEAIEETSRRRSIQEKYNKEHGIIPQTINKQIREVVSNVDTESKKSNKKLSKKELEKKIKVFAKDIQTKYIDVPNTTEFGIMFLPVEGLYAEVLRIPGLFETIQRDYHVTITGPTTILAFLNSLQMGFRCLTVEKKTSEIWKVLGAVRTEFGKFGDILEKTRDKLTAATNELDKTGARSRAIEKQLRNVEALPEVDAQKLLGNSLDYGNEDDEQ